MASTKFFMCFGNADREWVDVESQPYEAYISYYRKIDEDQDDFNPIPFGLTTNDSGSMKDPLFTAPYESEEMGRLSPSFTLCSEPSIPPEIAPRMWSIDVSRLCIHIQSHTHIYRKINCCFRPSSNRGHPSIGTELQNPCRIGLANSVASAIATT